MRRAVERTGNLHKNQKSVNIFPRVVLYWKETPKLYFCDTGLCAYLSMWLTPDTLRNGAASGHYYENYVVMELVKNYAYAKSKVNLTYFRDSNAKEIDVFVEENNVIHPLEIKKSAAPGCQRPRHRIEQVE